MSSILQVADSSQFIEFHLSMLGMGTVLSKRCRLVQRLRGDPEKRHKVRVPVPGLIAYSWTGGVPEPQTVRNISSSGLFLVTQFRFYLGTHVRLTIVNTIRYQAHSSPFITAYATAVRSDEDGVGLRFIRDDSKSDRLWPFLYEAASGKEIDQFVQGFNGACG